MQPGARRSCGRCAKAEDHSASPLEDVFARPSTRGLGWAGDNLLICESEGWVPERSAQGKTRGTNGGRIRAESLQPRREMTKAQRWIGEDSRVLRSRSRGQRWEELAKLINSLGTAESAGATTLHHSSSTLFLATARPHSSTPSRYHVPWIISISFTAAFQPSKWAGFLGPPATPIKPLTAAASPRIDQVARAAGRVATSSSPAWTGTKFSMESKMTRMRDGNARRKCKNSRPPVLRLGYVLFLGSASGCIWPSTLPFPSYYRSMQHKLKSTLGEILQGKASDGV